MNINYTALVKNSNTNILSPELKSVLVDKLKETFTNDEQQIYIANLYMYLTFDQTKDYPINLDNVWNFLGFANKGNAKRTLENNFILNDDYKITNDTIKSACASGEATSTTIKDNGGLNKETILLNIDTFKNLCMLVKTENGKKIRKYYTKLESIYNEIIKEELENTNNTYKLQLENMNNEHKMQLFLTEKENQKILQEKDSQLLIKDSIIETTLDKIKEEKHNGKVQRELALVKANSKTNLVYLAETEIEINGVVEHFIKLGETTNIESRAPGLRTEYSKNTYIIEVYPTERSIEFEKRLFKHEDIKKHIHKLTLKNIEKKELIKLTSKFTTGSLKNIITKTLDEITKENFKLLYQENANLKSENEKLILENKLLKLTIENIELKSKLKIQDQNEHIQENIQEIQQENIQEIQEEIQEEPQEEIQVKKKKTRISTNKENIDIENFNTFLDNTVAYSASNCVLKNIDLVLLYKNDYKFSKYNKGLLSAYKNLLEEYIKKKYPAIKHKQYVVRCDGSQKGYGHLYIKPEFGERLKELIEKNEKYMIDIEEKKIKDHNETLFEKDLKLWEFFRNNIEYTEEKSVLQIIDIVERYENRKILNKTNICIKKNYKIQIENYIKETYPNMKFLQNGVKIDKKKTNGWYNFKLKALRLNI